VDFLKKRLPAQVGRYLEGVEFPARKEELLGRLERNGGAGARHRPAAQEAPGRRVPRPPGRLVGPKAGALAGCGKRPRTSLSTSSGE
jgi:hypothetical protein